MELNELTKLVDEKVKSLGYDLISLTSKNVKGEHLVSVVVDRVEPIDMDAIVEVSNFLNQFFDEINPFESNYTLDISSLGAEKPLKKDQLSNYVGSYVNVHLINPINGENIYEGTIKEANDQKIVLSYKIKTRVKDVEMDLNNISNIRLAIKF